MDAKTKIYGFFNSDREFGDAVGIAISEHGDVVSSHFSSSEGFSIHDLGMDGHSNWHHDAYDKAFPNGWEAEYVRIKDRDSHAGLQAALAANKAKAPTDER